MEIELDIYDYFNDILYGARLEDFLSEFYPTKSSRNEGEEKSLIDNLFDAGQ